MQNKERVEASYLDTLCDNAFKQPLRSQSLQLLLEHRVSNRHHCGSQPLEDRGTFPAINEATSASICSIILSQRPPSTELGGVTSVTGVATLWASMKPLVSVDLRGVSCTLLQGALTLWRVAAPRGWIEPTFHRTTSNPESTATNKMVSKSKVGI